jgi:hypothetical protein
MMDSRKRLANNPFARLGALARSVGTGTVSRAVDQSGERRAIEAFVARADGGSFKTFVGLASVFATAAAAFAIFFFQHSHSAVSWTVDGVQAGEGTYISPVQKEASVRFSEGTEFAVQRGSRLRVAEASAKTVKAVLEVGASRVRMGGRSPVTFKIEAGPFSVSPSSFANLMVEWLADELLHVAIFEGETTVTGTPSPLSLHAGQEVSANARDGTVQVRPLSNQPAPAPAVYGSGSPEVRELPAPPIPNDEPAPAVAPAVPSPGSPRRGTWSDSVAAGDYATVLREAERRGISSVLSDATLADLVAMADAARLSGRLELGKRAFTAERSRFPHTTAARDAAFYLGRIADDHEHATASAIQWYETYLAEAPRGHFAAEAFGRKMVAIAKQSGPSSAQPIAREYLQRFPTGPHAAMARDLAGQ